VVTPHTAGHTDGTARRRAEGSAINIDRIADGLEPLYRVDRLPKV
jgi:phosphoglycerate dehydrogenase-like enzyme